jgi:hypothetical protein
MRSIRVQINLAQEFLTLCAKGKRGSSWLHLSILSDVSRLLDQKSTQRGMVMAAEEDEMQVESDCIAGAHSLLKSACKGKNRS